MGGNSSLVLVAEDEESDQLILRLGFEKASLDNPLKIVSDGTDVVKYLAGDGSYGDRTKHPLPSLLILDLKMPRMSGFDVLAWLAQRPEFKALPTVILSSSSADADIKKAREMGARDYFIKPHSFTGLVAIIQKLHSQWLAA